MLRLIVVLPALGLLLIACGGGGTKPILGGSTPGSVPPTALSGTTVVPATLSATTPVPGNPPASPLDAAVQAAVATVAGVSVPDGKACMAQTRPCIIHGVDPDSPDKGIAVMELGDPQGGGAMFVMGQKADMSWAFWFGTQQQVYHALTLPAQMRVCADGTGVNVRQNPDETSGSLGLIKDGTIVTADRFVLTLAGTYGKPGPSGNGWYAISAPSQGYVRADFLSVTSLPDCQLRDALIASAAKGN